jgi:cell division protein FtsB
MQGYSGFFDLVQVDEELLDRIYDFDVNLMEQVESLARSVEKLPARPDQITAALPDLHHQADAIEKAWDQRENILSGLD